MPDATVRQPVHREAVPERSTLDPKLQAIADQLVDAAQSCAERAFAAEVGRAHLSDDEGALDHAFAKVLRAVPEGAGTQAREAALKGLARQRLLPIDLMSATSIERQVRSLLEPTAIDALRGVVVPLRPVPGARDVDAKAAEHPWLGAPTTGVTTCPDGAGRHRHYERGSVWWSPATGAHEVHGAIRDAWAEMGWEASYLGYPTSDELTAPDGLGRLGHFQGGTIYWRPERGAFAVHTDLLPVYGRHGWERGHLGYPVEPTQLGEPKHQRFEGGRIRGGAAEFPKTMLVCRLHEVRVLDETGAPGFGEAGHDGVLLAGTVLDQGGNREAFGPIGASRHGTGGTEERRFGGRALVTSMLTASPGWPKTYVATLLLAEEDGRELARALVELVDKLAEWAKKELSELLTQAGTSIAGAVGGIVGAVLGEVVAIVIDRIAGWFAGLFEDVVLSPAVSKVTVGDVWQAEATTDRVQEVVGGGGRYRVTFDFALR